VNLRIDHSSPSRADNVDNVDSAKPAGSSDVKTRPAMDAIHGMVLTDHAMVLSEVASPAFRLTYLRRHVAPRPAQHLRAMRPGWHSPSPSRWTLGYPLALTHDGSCLFARIQPCFAMIQSGLDKRTSRRAQYDSRALTGGRSTSAPLRRRSGSIMQAGRQVNDDAPRSVCPTGGRRDGRHDHRGSSAPPLVAPSRVWVRLG
jgi:hypothetical protein